MIRSLRPCQQRVLFPHAVVYPSLLPDPASINLALLSYARHRKKWILFWLRRIPVARLHAARSFSLSCASGSHTCRAGVWVRVGVEINGRPHTTKLTASNMEKVYYQEKEGPRWFVRCALFPVVQPRIFLTHFDLGAGAH